jgi:hypothetical protein
VRGYNGQKSRWYQAALQQKAGRIIAAGMTKEVAFEPAEEALNNEIDEAYRAKYRESPYLCPMIGVRARSATMKVMPRDMVAHSIPSQPKEA